jgi:Na+-driven multidrug efflux pump
MLVFRAEISTIFTNIKEISDYSTETFRLIAFYFVIDSWQCVASGLMRGMGKAFQATIITLISYFGIAIPL